MKINNRQNRSSGEIDRVERVIRSLFPSLDATFRGLERLVHEFEPATPRVARAKFTRILTAAVPKSKAAERLFLRLIKSAMRHPRARAIVLQHLDELIALAKAEARKDARYSLLLNLMREADRKTPFGGAIVTFRHADLDRSFEIDMNSLSKIEQARSLTGERRAEAARQAFRETVDFVYTPYIKTLVGLSLIRMGKPLEGLKTLNDMKFGVAVDHLKQKLSDYRQLFDPRVAWMRNSFAHVFAPYDLDTDTFILKDAGGNPVAFTTNDLIEIAEDMFQLAGVTAARVGQLYLFREIFRRRGLAEALIEHLPKLSAETDPRRIAGLEADLKLDLEQRFSGSSG